MEFLEKERIEIDLIDKEMAKLFEKRMAVVQQIAHKKKEQGIKIHDPIRENDVIKKNMKFIRSNELKVYYQDYMEMVIEISKAFQEEILDN